MSSLYKLCEDVAELDILVALAQVNIFLAKLFSLLSLDFMTHSLSIIFIG